MAVFRTIPAGDLDLINGSPYYISGAPYIRQKLSVRFRFFLGEWFLNQLEGVPYYRDVFTSNPNLDVVASLFKRIITTCPGVTGIASFALPAIDPVTRLLSFSFQAITDSGVITVTPQDQDFLVDTNRLAANNNAQRATA
jgi:hypothetical protein